MNIPIERFYRLVPRGGAGLACDQDGLALGAVELARTKADANGVRRCLMRSPDEIGHILRKSYGPQREETVLRLHKGLSRAAALIEAGELCDAGVHAVMLGFPDLTPEAVRKLAEVADLEKDGAAWETEPRRAVGQAGGGQWTTSGGAPSTAVRPTTNVGVAGNGGKADRKRRKLKPAAHVRNKPAVVSSPARNADRIAAADGSRLIPISTVTVPFGGSSHGGIMPLPQGVARPAGAGLLGVGAALLDQWDANRARTQVANAIARLGLDQSQPADVTAATAYVWAKSVLPLTTSAPFEGPALEAASQAVMRIALVRPDAFKAMLGGGDANANTLFMTAAAGGLADYLSESKARPKGVDPSLQANSYKARKAIGLRLNDGSMQAHHLVTVEAWGKYADIAKLAQKAKWEPNAASNLIALPSYPSAQLAIKAETGILLPIHLGSHAIYNANTLVLIELVYKSSPAKLTEKSARGILDLVAIMKRTMIISGAYGEIIKVEK